MIIGILFVALLLGAFIAGAIFARPSSHGQEVNPDPAEFDFDKNGRHK